MSSRRQQRQQNSGSQSQYQQASQQTQQGFVPVLGNQIKQAQRQTSQYMEILNDSDVARFLEQLNQTPGGQYYQIGESQGQQQYQKIQKPQPQPVPTGFFGRVAAAAGKAKSAAMKGVGIRSQQQVRQQQYMKKGKQLLGKLSQANKNNINKAMAAIKKLKPRMPELTEEQMIRLQLLLAQPLNRLRIIKLSDEDKFWLSAARARRSARKAYNRVASGITGATAAARSMFRSGGATGGAPKRTSKISPKRKTKSKKSAKPKKKTMH